MGNSCCIKPPTKKHYIQIEEIPEEIHVAVRPTQEPIEHLITKRTSEPSLLPLNNQITNLIHTFQKCHGTISNSFTRTQTVLNSLSLAPKIKHQQQQISEIFFKPNRLNQNSHIRTNTGQKTKIQFLPAIKQNRQSQVEKIYYEIEKVSEKENKNSLKKEQTSKIPIIKLKTQPQKHNNLDISSSSWEEQNNNDSDNNDEFSEQQSNILGDSLINEAVANQRLSLINNHNVVQDIVLNQWDEDNLQNFSLYLDSINCIGCNSIYVTSLAAISIYYQTFKISLCAFRKVDDHSEVKIYINGHKRFMPLENSQSPTRLFCDALALLYRQSNVQTNPSNQIYHLSGWVPQILYLSQIHNKNNLWDRLVENFNQGNILISFQNFEDKDRYLTLHSIDIQNNKLKLITISSNQKLQYIQLTWQQLLQTISDIYINWNPSIYSFSKKLDSKWIPKGKAFENQSICLENNPQYLIKIPKHSQDFQIRVFADRYIRQFSDDSRLAIKLFQYDGSRILNPNEAIRTLEVVSRELISDVFIFEKSDTVDYFVLVVLHDEEQRGNIEQQIAFSLLFLSFVDVQIKELPRRQVLLNDNIVSSTGKHNIGYGLNSPFFLNNLQYTIKTSPQSFLQVLVQSSKQCQFTLILVEDKNHNMDIVRIDFQTVLNESVITQGFQKYGFIQKQTTSQYYMLIIALSKAYVDTKFKIVVNTMSKMFKRNKQIESCYSTISIDEIAFKPKIIKQIDIDWTEKCTGPRKRLKHTSTQVVYHPASVFEDFLKNPTIVLKLQKGNYQFNLTCEDYKKQFLKGDHSQGEPPALCISVLKNSDNNKGYKIIVDDAFYVPIGYGFWTPQLALQQGRYTIVCARVDQSNSKGKLRLRKF